MRTGNVRLMLLAGLFIAVARATDVTASLPQTTTVSYATVVEHYRRGDDDLAFKELAALSDTNVRTGLQRLLEALSKGNSAAASMLRAAAVLHTVRAFAARAHYDGGEFAYQFGFAQASINAVMSYERKVSPFVQTWQLFVLSSYHGQRSVREARDFGRRVHDPHGAPALFLLALGATEEMGWAIRQAEDGLPSRRRRNSLSVHRQASSCHLIWSRRASTRQDPRAAYHDEG